MIQAILIIIIHQISILSKMRVNVYKISKKRNRFLVEKIFHLKNLNYHKFTITKLNIQANRKRLLIKFKENKLSFKTPFKMPLNKKQINRDHLNQLYQFKVTKSLNK